MANDLTAFEAERWSTRMVEKLDQMNIALPLVNRNWEGDLRGSKTVHIRTPGSLATAPYTPGTTISYQDLTPTDETFTVNDGEYFAFEVDDINKAQTDLNAMDIYMARGIVAMNNTVESKILSAYTNTPAANQITASGAAIALDSSTSTSTGIYPLITQMRAILSKNNVPSMPSWRWLMVDPDTTTLLLNDTAHFVKAGDLGDVVVQYGLLGGEEIARKAMEAPGFIGRIAGFDVYETPHVPTASGAKFLLAGDREAISYVSQITEIERLRLQTTFATAVRALLLHGVFVTAENAKRLSYIKAVA